MLSALNEWIFGTGLAPHGYCLLWEPGLIWLYAISDTAIALAYYSIPLALMIIGRRRSDLVFRPMLWLFAAFIVLCGTTHWLDLVTLWTPLYGLQGIVKAATAVASVGTAVAMWRLLPDFLALPSTAQLHQANAALRESEERLAHSQKMETLGQLTGGIAHDFNNLLQVIVGSVSVIEHQMARGPGNDIRPAVAAIKKASESASSLINRLLAFSSRQSLLPRVIEPRKLVAGMADLLRRTLGPEIALELSLGNSRWNVTCDPSQLESALLNLAINARDAMPQGGALAITTADRTLAADPRASDANPGNYVEFEVRDTGVGMSREVLERAFEPFFTTKANGKGTGLGLSQIYGFVKQSGGFVRIESSPGKGTSVRIYLPGHDLPPETLSRTTATVDLSDFAGARVLVVEHQAEVRAQIADTINGMGFFVIEASDSAAGMKMLESDEDLDLLVADVGLSGLDGRQLAEAARIARPDLPILLVGYAGDSDKALKLAPDIQILRKPFTLGELTARIQTLMKSPALPR